MVADRLRAVPAWAWLAGIVLVSFALRAWLARGIVAPFIMTDELTYSELAKSLAESGERLVRDLPAGGYGIVYPTLIAPAYALFDSVPQAYAALKTINALVMSLAAIPAYLLARSVLPMWWSLAAAALAVAVPSMAYTGTVMTENAFYPMFLFAVYALVWMLERPTLLRQAVLLLVVGLAILTRLQAIALVPALLTAPLLLALAERSTERLRRLLPLYVAVVGGGLLLLAGQALRGKDANDLLGSYAVVGEGGYDLGRALEFLAYHWAELDLYLGVVPFAATIVLVRLARDLDEPLQRLLAVAVAASFWLVLVVSVFASKFADRIQERNAFVVAPLFLVLMLAWIQRGAPRPGLLSPAAAAAAVLAILVIPFDRFINESAKSDTLALLPWWSVQDVTGIEWVAEIAFALALAVGVLFVAVPRRYALVLAGVVALYFVVVVKPVWFGAHGFRVASSGALFQGIRDAERDWIDTSVPDGATVGVVWSGLTDRFTVNLNEFFNRSVGPVYYLRAPTPGGEGSEQHVTIGPGGVVRLDDGTPVDDRYVLLDSAVDPDGRPLGRDPGWGLTVYRVQPPLQSTTQIAGLYDDGWSGSHVTYTRRRCSGGTVAVSLSGDPTLLGRQSTTVTARTGSGRERTVTYAQDAPAALKVPLTPVGGRCLVRFEITPTAVPAEVIDGSTDRRELGTHFVAFTYEP